jgi:hypothetical protein
VILGPLFLYTFLDQCVTQLQSTSKGL